MNMAFKIALVLHLLGICNWFGAAGVQVYLLSSFKKGKDSEFIQWSEKMALEATRSIELPGMFITLLTGIFLLFIRSGGLSIFSERWFQAKVFFALCLAAQTFYELSACGKIVRMREGGEKEETLTAFKKSYLVWGKVITLIALGVFYFALHRIYTS